MFDQTGFVVFNVEHRLSIIDRQIDSIFSRHQMIDVRKKTVATRNRRRSPERSVKVRRNHESATNVAVFLCRNVETRRNLFSFSDQSDDQSAAEINRKENNPENRDLKKKDEQSFIVVFFSFDRLTKEKINDERSKIVKRFSLDGNSIGNIIELDSRLRFNIKRFSDYHRFNVRLSTNISTQRITRKKQCFN